MIYTVYILFSEQHQKIYIGYSSHLINRFHSHNQLGTKGWTKNFRPWIVVYCEYYDAKPTAMKREHQLKSAAARHTIWNRIKAEFQAKGFIANL